ncbi:MAG: tyrosine recombinase [candidate division Zixibacteria bacterium]|nr:tyrosine recombinase [candidate division Zixibacteria bacterium]
MPLSKKHLQLFEDYLRSEKNYSEHTVTAYIKDIKLFQQFFRDSGVELKRLDSDFFDLFRRFLQYLRTRPMSNRSIARLQSSLKSYFRYLYIVKATATDYSTRIRPVRFKKPLPEVATRNQIESILNLAEGDSVWQKRDSAIMELFYSSGLRRAELASLSVEDIDYGAGVVRVLGKGGKERIVPVGDVALARLQQYLHQRNRELKRFDLQAVFVNRRGGRLSQRSIGRIVRRYASDSGLMQKFSPHSFRHSFATHILEGGADLSAVGQLLGHSSLSSTQIYTHVSLQQLRKVYKKTHPRA